MLQQIRIIFICCVALAVPPVIFAQSYTIQPNDSINLVSTFGDLETLSIQQLNTSGTSLTLGWKKVSESVPLNWSAVVCDNSTCYTSLKDSGTMTPVMPGEYGFILLHIKARLNVGTAVVRYAVWDVGAPQFADTLTFVMKVSSFSNPLFIPPALTGTTFNLDIQDGTTQFFPGVNTPTFGINGALLAPTLILNKWDWVTMNVTNNLAGNGNSTTMHWHGLHVPAEDDGGPHQIITQGSTWSPDFQVLNDAATFWYHPHGQNKTDRHVSKGLAGMIIVKDSVESALILPRTYGVDDIPLIVQTKCFDIFNQIAIATPFDTVPMVNGVINPYHEVPSQVVRLRFLNGASERTFLFGFSNNMSFQLIATDAGLLDAPVTLNRLKLSNGERAEILVDLAAYVNDTIFLKSYGSELPDGIMGAAVVGDSANQIEDYSGNYLNGADFDLLQLNVVAQTGSPVTSIPASLVTLNPWVETSADNYRTFVFDSLSDGMMTPNLAAGPFGINSLSFHADSVNEIVHLNSTEVWTLINKTMVAHPFHIHDVSFFILDINGDPIPDDLKGKKDVVQVMPDDTVRFITRFEDFADDSVPYMFHCHILHHEDDGMMGAFLVIDTTTGINDVMLPESYQLFPDPASSFIKLQSGSDLSHVRVQIFDLLGSEIKGTQVATGHGMLNIDISNLQEGIYFIRVISGHRHVTLKFVKI